MDRGALFSFPLHTLNIWHEFSVLITDAERKAKTNIYITFMFYSKNTVRFVYTVPLFQFLWLAMKPL